MHRGEENPVELENARKRSKKEAMQAIKARMQLLQADSEPEELEQGDYGDPEKESEESDDDNPEASEDDMNNDGSNTVYEKYTWHFDMLNDFERNRLFAAAIDTAVKNALAAPHSTRKSRKKKQRLGAKQISVLDIGTGSGLLAMLAAKAGANEVIAVEVDPVLADKAQENVLHNGFGNTVTVHAQHSTELKMKSRADILVAELLDSALLGEDFLPTLRDSQRRLLKPNAQVVPASATVFAQLVESIDLHHWQYLDEDAMGCKIPEDILEDCGPASPSSLPYARMLESKQIKPLSAPFECFDFDFCHLPEQEGRCLRTTVKATSSGVVHAVVFWWSVKMDREGKSLLSNKSSERREHWTQAVSFIKTPVAVKKNQPIRVLAAHNDDDIWFPLIYTDDNSDCGPPEITAGAPPMPQSETGLHDQYDVDRLWSLCDAHRRQTYKRAMEQVLTVVRGDKSKGSLVCLDCGDGPWLTIMAGQLGAKNIVSLETSENGVALTEAFVAANGLENSIRVVHGLDLMPVLDKPRRQIDVVFAEPYFQALDTNWSEGSLMMFCSYLDEIRPYLSSNVKIMPSTATLRGVLVECTGLYSMRQPVQKVEGLDLQPFNELHSFDQMSSIHLWKHRHKLLSEPFDLLCLNLYEVCVQTFQRVDSLFAAPSFFVSQSSQHSRRCYHRPWRQIAFVKMCRSRSRELATRSSYGSTTVWVNLGMLV